MIRRYLQEDFEQLKKLCHKYEIGIPFSSDVWVSEIDGKVKGIVGVRIVPFIEPLIAENPLAGKKLFDTAEQFITYNSYNITRVFADPKNEKLFNKAGFGKVFENKIIMEKYYERS